MASDFKLSASPRRRGRKMHRESSGELSIEELFPNDMAYDADCEVVYPDQYQDADSENEEETSTQQKWRSIDEELADRMSQLGRDRSETRSSLHGSLERGKKRQSVEIEDDLDIDLKAKLSELEVMEIQDELNDHRPTKRRKKRVKPSGLNQLADEESAMASLASSDIADNTGLPRDNGEAMDTS